MQPAIPAASINGESSRGAGSVCYIALGIISLMEKARVRIKPWPPSEKSKFYDVLHEG